MALPLEVRDIELFPGAEASEVNLKALHEVVVTTGLLHACKDGISVNIGRKGRRLQALMLYSAPGDMHSSHLLTESDFPNSPQGVAGAMAFIKGRVAQFRSRGPCPRCVARDPPLLRLCVGDLALCESCCLERAVGL